MFAAHFTPADTHVIAKTIAFIAVAHEGQLYGDMPYFLHPVEVAGALVDSNVNQILGALLHDTVEDTSWSLNDLGVIYSAEVIEIVRLLTKDTTMSYRANIQKIIDSGNADAMHVKLADNMVNISGDKSHMSKERHDRLMTKYSMSIEMLIDALRNLK
jgi:GTP pyrophosphokinase